MILLPFAVIMDPALAAVSVTSLAALAWRALIGAVATDALWFRASRGSCLARFRRSA
ncbi:hypothetical protein [Aliigemmobacter aestuarii]